MTPQLEFTVMRSERLVRGQCVHMDTEAGSLGSWQRLTSSNLLWWQQKLTEHQHFTARVLFTSADHKLISCCFLWSCNASELIATAAPAQFKSELRLLGQNKQCCMHSEWKWRGALLCRIKCFLDKTTFKVQAGRSLSTLPVYTANMN